MNFYRYKIIESTGETSSGIIRLHYTDTSSAISLLERDGSMVVFVKKLGPIFSFIVKLATMSQRKKLSRMMQSEILSNLAMMLKSGVTLTTAMEEVGECAESREVKNDFKDIIAAIQGGIIFSEAAKNYPHIFPESVIHLIKIGEETGNLDKMMKDASEHLKRMQEIVSDTKQALIYPSFVFLAMGSLLIFWFYYVVPKILNLFMEMDVTLPPLTIFLVSLSDFVQSYIFYIIGGTILSVVAIQFLRKYMRWFRKITDYILLNLPITGTIIHASLLAYVTEYLSLLINSGVDIIKSIRIMKTAIKNEVYRDKMQLIIESLKRGEGISSSFTSAVIFPSLVTRMIGVGEMSGTLSEQLESISLDYRNKLSIVVATLGKILEPVVLIIAGAMFAVIIAGLLLPIYDLVSQISS